MLLEFRRLAPNDIPLVNDLTKGIWDGHDYIPSLIAGWIAAQKICYPFGAFNGDNLVGIGNVRWIFSSLAWIEGIRVRPNIQRQGIGRQLFQHAMDYAQENSANLVQYSCFSQNRGSYAIGQELGFREVHRMNTLFKEVPKSQLSTSKANSSIKASIFDRTLYQKLESIVNGPNNHFCIGWGYIPTDFSLLEALHGKWYSNDSVVAYCIQGNMGALHESPSANEVWFIIYGDAKPAYSFLEKLLHDYQYVNYTSFSLFCPNSSTLSQSSQQLGFQYENNIPSGVLLLEKRF